MSSNEDGLLAKLLATPTTNTPRSARTAQVTSSLEVKGDRLDVEVKAPKGEADEGKAAERLVEEGLDPAEWKANGFRSSQWTMANGELGESRKFSYVRIGSAIDPDAFRLPDLDDLHAQVQREGKWFAPKASLVEHDTEVCVIADVQAGKVSTLGGTEDLLVRLEASRAKWVARLERIKPHQIVLVDNGDAIENFESGGAPDRTNDLQLTEQIRVWRRIFWSWVTTAAQHAPEVVVISVPSNHCRVRRGKAPMGPSSDDYGIEVLHQVADMAAVYPEQYGHVTFMAPLGEEEWVSIVLNGGKTLGFAHGHQVSSIEKLPTWMANQALGRTGIGAADIAVFGHFHNLRIQAVGDDRWLFVAPTSDNGSAWFKNISGAESAPGVLTFVVDGGGWRDLEVC